MIEADDDFMELVQQDLALIGDPDEKKEAQSYYTEGKHFTHVGADFKKIVQLDTVNNVSKSFLYPPALGILHVR